MHYSLEMLVRGKAEVVEYYRLAAQRWQEIWSRPEATKLGSFARLLTTEQPWFEQHCGGRWLGQEVMVVSGLAGLYKTVAGFDGDLERARLLYDAFLTSLCSVAVKSSAEKVARAYNLLEPSRV